MTLRPETVVVLAILLAVALAMTFGAVVGYAIGADPYGRREADDDEG